MRERADVLLTAAVAAFALSGLAAVAFSGGDEVVPVEVVEWVPVQPGETPPVWPATTTEAAPEWFVRMKQYCNAVEVETRMGWSPPPETDEGTMYAAACFALAGRIDDARELVLSLPEEARWQGVGVVFEAGHPAADAGDELAAGPLMELVVEFWPNHYMALYHAGAAAFERGDPQPAELYLRRFLEHYASADGWRTSAESMLEQIGDFR